MFLHRYRIAVTGVVLGSMLLVGPAQAQEASTTLEGHEIRDALIDGTPVDLRNTTIQGDIDLSGIPVIEPSFRCRNCRIDGGFKAVDATFRGIIDLSGTTITGAVSWEGTAFLDPVVFSSTAEQVTTFRGDLDAELAAFGDVVRFDGAGFAAGVDFTSARFDGAVSFAGTIHAGPVDFEGASFSDWVSFASIEEHERTEIGQPPGCRDDEIGSFHEVASFSRATFDGFLDFRGRCAAGDVDLRRATFRGGSDFSAAWFLAESDFVGAGFLGRGTFLGTRFRGEANFTNATAAEPLVFAGSVFGSSASFFRFGSTDSLDLRTTSWREIDDAELAGSISPPLAMNRLEVAELLMDVEDVFRIDGSKAQQDVLALVEQSAKARGDLTLANEARFELQVMKRRDYSLAWQPFDWTIYMGLLGYLVRPMVPLRWLALLVGAVSTGRFVADRIEQPGVPFRVVRRIRSWLRNLWTRLCDGARRVRKSSWYKLERIWRFFFGSRKEPPPSATEERTVVHDSCWSDRYGATEKEPKPGFWRNVQLSAAQILASKPVEAGSLPAPLAWIENLTYKFLLGGVVIGLANSNPTLRQMFDAIL